MHSYGIIIFFVVFFIILDFYIFQAVKVTTISLFKKWKGKIYTLYWGFSLFCIGVLLLYNFGIPSILPGWSRSFIIVGLFIIYLAKLFSSVILLLEDIYRGLKWLFLMIFKRKKHTGDGQKKQKHVISRSEFISKAALVATSIPIATFSYGIASGAHNYRVRRKTIYLPNLPDSFDGITIGQISDIHSGSFFDKKGVMRGIDLFMEQKADIAFFTGDMVNQHASELKEYKDMFAKIKAPLGMYSILGNHDYGDYIGGATSAMKKKSKDDLVQAQKEMGWDILLNENRTIKVNGEEIGVIGVENWGKGRFSKHGDLEKAYKGMEETPVKILLSHDPSHWDAQVTPDYKDIDLTLSGHTHGFQFGIEIAGFKWSPSQYIYKQWAGLYQNDQQYLYVNRGFGFIGYPGRIGIYPEITILELKKA